MNLNVGIFCHPLELFAHSRKTVDCYVSKYPIFLVVQELRMELLHLCWELVSNICVGRHSMKGTHFAYNHPPRIATRLRVSRPIPRDIEVAVNESVCSGL